MDMEVDRQKLELALISLMSSCVKRDDAPCSSETHFDSALVSLYELIGCEISSDIDPELKGSLNDAIEHMNYYRSITGKSNIPFIR